MGQLLPKLLRSQNKRGQMDVTVAVCTWNRAALLDQTLEQMHRLTVPSALEWELLVVNNNCTDDTDAVIAKHGVRLPIRRLFEPRPGKSYAANQAVQQARGDLVLWTDDDVLVDGGWLASLIQAAARHPHAAGFGGPIEPWFPVSPDPDYLAAFPALHNGFCGIENDHPEGPIDTEAIYGANMAFRRDAHLNHSFDTALGPRPRQLRAGGCSIALSVGGDEEVDLVRKVRSSGAQIVWVPTMRVKHYVDPGRMTYDYIRLHTMDLARQSVHWQGIPPGKRVLGVPRWLLREWIEVTAAYSYSRLWRHRRLALAKKYRQWQLAGTIMGCFTESQRTRQIVNQ